MALKYQAGFRGTLLDLPPWDPDSQLPPPHPSGEIPTEHNAICGPHCTLELDAWPPRLFGLSIYMTELS